MLSWIRAYRLELLLVAVLLCGLVLLIWGVVLRPDAPPTEVRVEMQGTYAKQVGTLTAQVEILQQDLQEFQHQHSIDIIAICLALRDLRESR